MIGIRTGALHSTTTAPRDMSRATNVRGIDMNTLHEALARERIREREQRSREASLAREVTAQRRWRRVSLYARAAEARHAERVRQASAHR